MIPFLYETISQSFSKIAALYPDRPALWQHDRIISYEELNQLTDAAAAGFISYGMQPGSHAAILGEPDIHMIIAFLGLQKAGIVTFVMNTCLKSDEIIRQIGETDTEYMIIGKSFKKTDYISDLRGFFKTDADRIKRVIYVGDQDDPAFISLSEVISCGRSEKVKKNFDQVSKLICVQKPALILATSGTTGGKAKYVVLSMFHLINGGYMKAAALGMTENDVVCCAMPLFHIFCIDVNVMAAFITGACLCLPETRRSRAILSSIEAAGCTLLSSVPSIFYSLVSRIEKESFDISSLRNGIIGGAYCPPEKFIEIEQKLGLTLLSGLGQTEAAAGITVNRMTDPVEVRSTTVGQLVDHMEARIVDEETGETLGTGQAGELLIRGRMLMLGYYKAEELTKAAFDEHGFMHTGDVGFFDAQGNLHLTARIKDMINRGGEKVNPNEIERLVMMIHGVRACKAVPVPDEHYGEQVCLAIECDQRSNLAEEEIREILSQNLADYKLPAYYIFTSFLPRTATGKFKQDDIINMAATDLKRNR